MTHLDSIVVGFILGWGICLVCLLLEGVYDEVDTEDSQQKG
jgi:hypothetical protein